MKARLSSFCFGLVSCVVVMACAETAKLPPTAGVGPHPTLPGPEHRLIPTVDVAPARGWADGEAPKAAAGLKVAAFAKDLEHPRWLYVLPNRDVLVAESSSPGTEPSKGLRSWVMGKLMARAGSRVPSPNRIVLLRDADGDGVAEKRTVLLQNLNSPFGMALVGDQLYVAHADALWRYTYAQGSERITDSGVKVIDLPSGINHHWTKNVLASADGSKLYVTVGSNSNAAEHGMEVERGRAAIWEVDPKTRTYKQFATGLRNPNGLDWNPDTGALWTVVNERDELGSDLVPDYLTSIKEGAFYGWPYSYFGQHVDPRVEPQRPDLVAKAVVPDFALGTHVAPLGMVFVPRPKGSGSTAAVSPASALPATFASGAFIGEHGSWNRKPRNGYQVVFVPFEAGKPKACRSKCSRVFLASMATLGVVPSALPSTRAADCWSRMMSATPCGVSRAQTHARRSDSAAVLCQPRYPYESGNISHTRTRHRNRARTQLIEEAFRRRDGIAWAQRRAKLKFGVTPPLTYRRLEPAAPLNHFPPIAPSGGKSAVVLDVSRGRQGRFDAVRQQAYARLGSRIFGGPRRSVGRPPGIDSRKYVMADISSAFSCFRRRKPLQSVSWRDSMTTRPTVSRVLRGVYGVVIPLALLGLLAGCGSSNPPAPASAATPQYRYLIGPLDSVNIIVWRNPELSIVVPVRPDGRISTPLVEDLPALGRSPSDLARDVEKALAKFIRDPIVTVLVTTFQGPYSEQIRIIGEAARPQAISYRQNMTLLDVMIQVGGLTDFADGNSAVLVRGTEKGKQYSVRLKDLIKRGDISANVDVKPGDVIIIPQSWF